MKIGAWRDINEKNIAAKPRCVGLELTGKCNLKCIHCGYNTNGRTSNREIDNHIHSIIVDELFPACEIIHLGGGNYSEVTIASKFKDTLFNCLNYNVKINLTTNGTNIQKKWASELVDTLNVTVNTSLLPGKKEIFDKVLSFKRPQKYQFRDTR